MKQSSYNSQTYKSPEKLLFVPEYKKIELQSFSSENFNCPVNKIPQFVLKLIMGAMMFRSLRSRITLLFSLLIVLTVLVLSLIFAGKTVNELTASYEENALDLLESINNHVITQYQSILFHKNNTLETRKNELSTYVSLTMAVVENYYADYQKGIFKEEEAKEKVISAIREMRYLEGVGYFWINDTGKPFPVMIMHPTLPELDGQYLDDPSFNCALGKDENLFKAFVDVTEAYGEGYVDYLWPKPTPEGLTEIQPKLSYVTLFKPWNWIVGTGVYIDDIDKEVQKRIDQVLAELNSTIPRLTVGESGYFYIFNSDSDVLVHPNLRGTNIKNLKNPETGRMLTAELMQAAHSENKSITYLWDKPGHEKEFIFQKTSYITYYEPLDWYIASSVYQDELYSRIYDLTGFIILVICITLLITLLLSVIISRQTVLPLKLLTNTVKKTDISGIPADPIPVKGTAETRTLAQAIIKMISRIQKSTEELEESELRFRQLSENIDEIFYLCSQDLKKLYYISPAYEDLWSIPLADVEKDPWNFYNAIVDEDKMRVLKHKQDIIQGIKSAQLPVTYRINSGSGRILWITDTMFPVYDNNGVLTRYAGVARDITQQKLADIKLLYLKSYLLSIIDSMPSVLIGIDRDMKITQWNKEAERETGYTAQEIEAKPLKDVFSRLEEFFTEISRSIESKEIVLIEKNPVIKNDKTYFEDITIFPLLGEDIEGAVIRIDDITRRVKFEKMMIQSEKMLSLGGLAAGMAHEIKNPLAGMMQNSQTILNRILKKLPENEAACEEIGISMDAIRDFLSRRKILNMLTLINETGKRASKIIKNMLSFSRQSQAYLSENQITGLIDETLELAANDYTLTHRYDFNHIKIIKEYDPNLPPIQCERSEVEQVLFNIIKNGAEAMYTKEEQSQFKIKAFQDNDDIVVEIEDNGPGIESEALTHLFEPFFTTKDLEEGTGLGLFVSYFIITQNHHGTLSVKSLLNESTTFTIRLPLNMKDT